MSKASSPQHPAGSPRTRGLSASISNYERSASHHSEGGGSGSPRLSATLGSPRAVHKEMGSPGAGGGESGEGKFKPKEEESHIRVITRIRPFNPREKELHQQAIEGKPEWEQVPLRSVIEFEGKQCIFLDNDKDWTEKERFQFDQCYWSIDPETQKSENGFADQGAIFDEYGQEILEQTWKGYNTCFFAYGQTGAGKTFSMMGHPQENPGVIPRLCRELFEQVEARQREAENHKESYVVNYRVEVRYLEIYNEQVKDLLWTLSSCTPEQRARVNPENMKVRSSPATGVFIENLTSVEVDSWQRMLDLIDLGNNSRHTASTKMNERSSRSHAIFKISLRQITTTIPKQKFEKPSEHIREAQINLVDLAGSERNKKTGATGDRLKEAASINKSLSCLKGVIDALADNSTTKGAKKRIPYRDSNLTSLLMDSLGGNSKTYMLVCLSPHADNADETMQTLRYGARARQIVNVVKVNENAASRAMMELEEELEKMKDSLDKTINSESVETLKVAIQAQEEEIQKRELARKEQEKALEADREARRKEMNLREAAAFANLHALAMARTRRDEGNEEFVKHQLRLRKLEAQARNGERHIEESEKKHEELEDQTEEAKKDITALESEIAQWERRQTRLQVFKRELIRTTDDQVSELRKIKDEKYWTILKARALAARINVNGERRMRQLQKEHDEDLKQSNNNNSEMRKKAEAQQKEKEDAIEVENEALRKQCEALEAEIAKVEKDKDGQIKTLEDELSSLKKEHKSLSTENASRIKQTEQDWEKKHVSMCQEMQEQYDQVQVDHDEKHAKMIESKEAAFKEQEEQLREKRETAIKHWEDKKSKVEGEGDQEFKQHEDSWKEKFGKKMVDNEGMRTQLRSVGDRDKKFADMAFRIDAVLGGLGNPKWKGDKWKKTHSQLTEYRNQYRHNEPSTNRLNQLLKADFTLQRAAQAPVLETTTTTEANKRATPYRSTTPIRATRK